jgi:hypothetical protein
MFVKDELMNLAKQLCNHQMKANKIPTWRKKPNMQNTPTPKNMNDSFLLDLLGLSKPHCSIV